MRTRPSGARLAVLTLALALVASLAALADEGTWTQTGQGVRVKRIAFIPIRVYSIEHFMKSVPRPTTAQAVIDADVDKKFVWTMLRDVTKDQIVGALKDGYAMNGFDDQAKIAQMEQAFVGGLAEGTRVTIAYDAAKKATTISVSGGATVTVDGAAFMRATWSLWFGKIDQSNLGSELLAKVAGG